MRTYQNTKQTNTTIHICELNTKTKIKRFMYFKQFLYDPQTNAKTKQK